ncbi:MAG: D-Ala-D-Ala carboxypeptidase family metallohydrolase [Gemmatimonadaceae bacterium]
MTAPAAGTLVDRRRPAVRRPRRSRRSGIGVIVLLCLSALGVVEYLRPEPEPEPAPFVHLAAAIAPALPSATATADAFGRSGEVKVRFSLPEQEVEFPLAISGSIDALHYQWVTVGDSVPVGAPRLLTSDPLVAPNAAGFYHISIVRDTAREILAEPTLAVMVPFDRKLGNWLNGYRIGTYLAERITKHGTTYVERNSTPAGFLEVHEQLLEMPLTRHLKIADFITHDDQDNVWPKYVALNPRLLDKLELILADLGSKARPELSIDVHSGFRSPSHNHETRRAARDSRHQYGDAADVQIDADGDGKITMRDEIRVMLAVERVERDHPDLVGGLGIYTSRRYKTPYLHIDARGKKSRWHG